MAKRLSLYEHALDTVMIGRFVARADDLNRPLTDEETMAEAKYQLEDLPWKGLEPEDERIAERQLKALIKKGIKRGL